MATNNCGISSNTRVHHSGNSPHIPPHKPPPFNPIMHPSPCLLDIQTFSLSSLSWYQSTSFLPYPLSDYQHTPLNRDNLSNYVILHFLHMAEPLENTFANPFVTLHNSLIYAFRTLSILLIPNKHLRFSIYTALILNLSFSFHIIASLAYIRTGTSNDSCKTLAHSSCKLLALTRDLIDLQL